MKSLSVGIPFDSGLDVHVGDTITGSFTFTPDPGDGGNFFGSIQTEATATFLVDGKTIATTSVGAGIRFGASDNQPLIDGPAGLQDRIRFGGVVDQLPTDPGIGVTQAGWTIDLAGPSRFVIGVPVPDTGLPLDTASQPDEVQRWNLLAGTPEAVFGSQMTLAVKGAPGSTIINARLRGFTRGSKPANWTIVWTISVILLLLKRRQY